MTVSFHCPPNQQCLPVVTSYSANDGFLPGGSFEGQLNNHNILYHQSADRYVLCWPHSTHASCVLYASLHIELENVQLLFNLSWKQTYKMKTLTFHCSIFVITSIVIPAYNPRKLCTFWLTNPLIQKMYSYC